ncbi:MAG: SbcC/MukB-like Walker B domain-containing protein, partial [bacterium]
DLETAEAARDKARQESERLQVKQTALTEEAEGLKDAHDRRQSFSEKLNEAKATGDKLRALNDRVEARDKAVTALKNAKAAEERAAKDEQAAAGALAKCQAELDALGNTELTVSTLEGVEKSLTDRAKALEEERALYDRFVEAGKSYADAQSILEQKKKLAQKKAYTASWLNQHYNDNIAGILAKDLLEGMPCPVCGSVHHPDPRVLSTDAVIDKAVVDAAEAAAKEAEDEANEKAKVCERKNAECDSLKTQLVERMPDVLEADWPSEIQRRQSENAAAQRENAGKLKLAKDADARKQRLQKVELPKAQKDVDNATERLKEASEARTKAETDHKNAEAEVTNAAAIMPAGWTPLDLSDALSENGRQQAAMKQGREAAERDIRRLDEIGKQREQNRQSIDAQSKIAQNQEVKIAELETSIKNGQQALDDLKAELPYPAKADCERAICEKSKQKKALEDAIKAAQNEENRLNQAIANTEGQIKPLEDALKDAPPADTAAEAIYKEAQAAHEQAAKLEKAVDKRRDNNRRQQEKLSKESEAARKQEAEYRMMKDVSDTANGDVTGKAKVTLETYAQAAYFDRIIAYANARLFHMSRHQFDLVRRDTEDAEKRSQTGLDLDIKDYANGQTRAVGTLSGGEGFLAALSLALGMSDAIQASKASAVQLDAMFVDEGFGSLSESFLELVMDELNDTAAVGHRLIGVISHVDEVKDGIERRIEVEKSALGVSTAKIR